MEEQHFLTTRWKSGYYPVSQVPSRVTVVLEDIRRPLEQHVDEAAQIFLSRVEGIGTVGTLFGKVYLSTDRRRATFQHSIVMEGAEVDEGHFLYLFRTLYGRSPDRTLYVLSNLLSSREHWEVAPLVRSILFGEEPVSELDRGLSSGSGLLIRAILDQWPESLRTLRDVGVEELDRLAGRLCVTTRGTDPIMPAVSEITASEVISEERTVQVKPVPEDLDLASSRGDAPDPGHASLVLTELLPAQRAQLESPPQAASTRTVTLDQQSGDATSDRFGSEAIKAGWPRAKQTRTTASSGWGDSNARSLFGLVLLALLTAGLVAFGARWWSAMQGLEKPSPPQQGPRSDATDATLGHSKQVEGDPPNNKPTPSVEDLDSTHASDEPPLVSKRSCYEDLDRDTYGGAAKAPSSDGTCAAGMVERGKDCDDHDAARRPGAREQCDGKDNDCDEEIDEGFMDANHNKKADCFEGTAKWDQAKLKVKTDWGSEVLYLSADGRAAGCAELEVKWRFATGKPGVKRLSLQDGFAICRINYKTLGDVLLDDVDPKGPTVECGREGYKDPDTAGVMEVTWTCCFDEADGASVKRVCREVEGSRGTATLGRGSG